MLGLCVRVVCILGLGERDIPEMGGVWEDWVLLYLLGDKGVTCEREGIS